MRAVRFHRDIYRGAAIDEATAALGRFANFVRKDEPAHWVVEVSAPSEARERRVALELTNHVLTLSRA
jgi:hypothetical protein